MHSFLIFEPIINELESHNDQKDNPLCDLWSDNKVDIISVFHNAFVFCPIHRLKDLE